MRILILCTGNSCRSQMAEAFLRVFAPGLDVESAGTRPEPRVSPDAIAVMRERGIAMEGARPKDVRLFLETAFDLVITVCDHARSACPVFAGPVARRLHRGFEDPAAATGTPEERRAAYRRVRDEIEAWARELAAAIGAS